MVLTTAKINILLPVYYRKVINVDERFYEHTKGEGVDMILAEKSIVTTFEVSRFPLSFDEGLEETARARLKLEIGRRRYNCNSQLQSTWQDSQWHRFHLVYYAEHRDILGHLVAQRSHDYVGGICVDGERWAQEGVLAAGRTLEEQLSAYLSAKIPHLNVCADLDLFTTMTYETIANNGVAVRRMIFQWVDKACQVGGLPFNE